MFNQAKGWLAVSLVALLAACSTAEPPSLTTTATSVLVSSRADRSAATDLSSTRLKGRAYIFVQAKSVKKVAFYLDDAARSRPPRRVERSAPYDLVGGSLKTANPLDSRNLKDGAHTLTLALTTTSGRVYVSHTPFRVENGVPAPTPTPVPTPTPTPAPAPAPAPMGFASEILGLVNDARSSTQTCGSRGTFAPTAPLTLEPRLAAAAQGHAEDMSVKGYFSHTGQDGSSVATRVTRQGYTWSQVGENIAYGYPDAAQVMAGWLKSEGHCANLMNPGYTELGVGKSGTYWVQVFARAP